MTVSIRKAKRGQAVARKRHIHMQFGSTNNMVGSSGIDGGGKMTNDNPYSRDGNHVKEAIQLAQSIVRLCSTFNTATAANNDTTLLQHQQLAAALDRLCILLTPDDTDINPSSQLKNMSPREYIAANVTGTDFFDQMERKSQVYDSSMAGMAANAILSQFIGANDGNLAVALANSLGCILSHNNNNNNTNSSDCLQIKAVIVLNQLAATDPPPPQQFASSLFEDSNVMLGNAPTKEIPTSWCHVIVNSTVLSLVLDQLKRVDNNNIALCEKCIFVIGNVLGDSFMARQTLLELGALPTILIACVKMGLEKIKLLGQQQPQQQQQQGDELVSALQLVRNSIWSLINFIRGGDTSSSSSSFMAEMTQHIDLAVLLSLPESIQSITNNSECISAAFNVAIETCWLTVFLTNYNEAMSFGIENWLSQDILMGLGTRLCSGVDAVIIQYKQIEDESDDGDALNDGVDQSTTSFLASNLKIAENVSNSSIPCCRALNNIAIYLDSIPQNGETIVQAKQSVTSALLSEMTARCLVELISVGSIGGGTEADTIACSATSLASIILTDASRDFEKYAGSTAVWSLLPALVQGLIGPMSFYDFRREILWAIWNMLQHNRLQQKLLMEIIGTSTEEVARALTEMLVALESSDAVEPALGLVDMLLRTLDESNMRATTGKSLKILFEEVGLVEALWYVCDNDVDESEVAEMAAELIDDFYEDQEEDVDDDGMIVTAPSVNGQQFQFQAPSHTGQFNFS